MVQLILLVFLLIEKTKMPVSIRNCLGTLRRVLGWLGIIIETKNEFYPPFCQNSIEMFKTCPDEASCIKKFSTVTEESSRKSIKSPYQWKTKNEANLIHRKNHHLARFCPYLSPFFWRLNILRPTFRALNDSLWPGIGMVKVEKVNLVEKEKMGEH